MATTPSKGAPQFDPNERFLTVGVVAEYFGVTEVTIKNWVDAGELLAARTVGGHRRIAASSVVTLLEQQGRAIPAALARRKPLVLLIDGDAGFVRAARRALATRVRIEHVDDDYAGLLAAARLHPEVILLDLHLAHADMRRLLGALRGDPGTKPADIIAIGSLASDAKLIGHVAAPAGATKNNGGSVTFFRRSELSAIVEATFQRVDRPHASRGARRR